MSVVMRRIRSAQLLIRRFSSKCCSNPLPHSHLERPSTSRLFTTLETKLSVPPTVLCVLDGWGYRESKQDNAIALGKLPFWNKLWETAPRALIQASEEEVGLPSKQIGNSEVGHMNLGAGRIVNQDILVIDRDVASGAIADKPAFKHHCDRVLAAHGVSHVMGLVSPGGVHSQQAHIVGLIKALTKRGVKAAIHAFTDGRDVPPKDARRSMEEFVNSIKGLNAQIVTVNGRYYAMDRDRRWERVQLAYDSIVRAKGLRSANALSAIEEAYKRGENDEFIKPTVLEGYGGIHNGDGVLFANFRADRARQLITALVDPKFKDFSRAPGPVSFSDACGMVEYSDKINKFVSALFPPKVLTKVLGELISNHGLKQLRIAETEKYPHVTFFFNGGREDVFAGEDRIMIPSPKVATYDLQPEMSAPEVTNQLVNAINSGKYSFFIVNFANPDMVGHSGKLDAAIKAVETVDKCLARISEAITKQHGLMLITADHGNCELMKDPETGEPHTAHTLNPVPLVLVNGPKTAKLKDGRLSDIAPTLLQLMKLPQPAEMTGSSLLTV